MVQEVPFEDTTNNVTITDVSVQDPYVLLRFSDGSVALLLANEQTKDLTICQHPAFLSVTKITNWDMEDLLID
jgi:hypothetical protein